MNEWFVELLDRAPPTQLRRAAQDIASHILLAYGPRCSMGQSCGRMPAVKRCPGWCVNFLGLNMEKNNAIYIPPMTGNGLYPTYLWWFVGMVVIIVLPTVNFLGVITHMEAYQPTTISWEVAQLWMGRLQVRPWVPWHPHIFAAPRLPNSLAWALSWRYNQWTPIEPQSCVVIYKDVKLLAGHLNHSGTVDLALLATNHLMPGWCTGYGPNFDILVNTQRICK